MSPLITQDLHKSFGKKKPVLCGVDFELAPGEVTVLLGANGAGKSTFLRLALGVLAPTRGSITVLGEKPTSRRGRKARTRIGYVPDVPDAWDWMTPERFWRFLAPQYPDWSDAVRDRIAGELDVPRDVPFGQLSRGQGMKAMLVAALAPQPELLLLDEPFGGLDPMTREDLLRGVISELREGERTVLLSTHELELAARIADRVAILRDGQIREHGTLEEILGEDEPRCVPQALHDVLRNARSRGQESGDASAAVSVDAQRTEVEA